MNCNKCNSIMHRVTYVWYCPECEFTKDYEGLDVSNDPIMTIEDAGGKWKAIRPKQSKMDRIQDAAGTLYVVYGVVIPSISMIFMPLYKTGTMFVS